MGDPKPLSKSDPCPSCGASLYPARQPTDAERAAADPRSEHAPLPPEWDTATPAQIAEHGPLYRCSRCAFADRIKG